MSDEIGRQSLARSWPILAALLGPLLLQSLILAFYLGELAGDVEELKDDAVSIERVKAIEGRVDRAERDISTIERYQRRSYRED
jgi:hypothetical protein